MRTIYPTKRNLADKARRALLGLMGLTLAVGAQPAGQDETGHTESKPTLQVHVQVRSHETVSRDSKNEVVFIPAPSVAGVRIEVCEYPIENEIRVLAAYLTDDRGQAKIQVPAEGFGKVPHDGTVVTMRVNHDGFQTRYVTSLSRSSDDPTGPYVTGFPLIQGGTLLGHVLGSDGRPEKFKMQHRVDGPQVVVAPIIDQGGCCMAYPLPRQGFQVLGPGSFAYHYTESGTADFLATVEGLGSAALHGIQLTLDNPPESIRLHIAGPGIIRGKVVDPDGNPRRSVSVLCSPASGQEAHARPGWKCENWSANNPGLLISEITTDAQGRFKFTGLRKGSYRLSLGNRYDRLLSLRPDSFGLLYEADGQGIVLVAVRGEVRIKLIDLDGNPVANVPFFPSPSKSKLPGTVLTISKFVATPWGQELSPSGHFDARTGETSASVQAGQTHWVRIRGGGFEDVQIPMLVDENGVSKPITIQATSQPTEIPSETGTIQVTVVDKWGDSLDEYFDYSLSVEVSQGGPPCNLQPTTDWVPGDEKPAVYELPVGQFKLVVNGGEGMHNSGAVYRPIRLGRTEQIIQVEKGSHKAYGIVLGDAGKLLVLLQGTTTTVDKLAAKFDRFAGPHSTWGPGLDPIQANAYPWEPESIAKLTLHHKSRPPIRVMHVVSGTSRMRARCDRWPLNQRIRSDYIPPGDYILVTDLAAGRRVEKKVTVTAGKIQGVRVIIP